MKKLTALCLALVLVAMLPGCNKKEAGPSNEWGEISTEDFGVYLDGEEVLAATAFTGGMFAFESSEEQNGLAGEGYTTRRGVLPGDSPEKLAGVYKGVECVVMGVADTAEDGDYSYADFDAYLDGGSLGNGILAVTYSLYFVEGEPMGWTDFYLAAEGGVHTHEDGEEHAGFEGDDVQGYSLVYVFNSGKISSIMLTYVDYANL